MAAEAATNFKNYYPLIRLYAYSNACNFCCALLLVYHFDNELF